MIPDGFIDAVRDECIESADAKAVWQQARIEARNALREGKGASIASTTINSVSASFDTKMTTAEFYTAIGRALKEADAGLVGRSRSVIRF